MVLEDDADRNTHVTDSNLTAYHPFHRFLPPHYIDKDGIPFSVKWAQRKARHIVSLVESLQLTEDILHQEPSPDRAVEEGILDEDLDDEEDDGGAQDILSDDEDCDEGMKDDVDKRWLNQPQTLASFVKKCHRIYTQLVALERLKHRGITQIEYCHIVLKVLRLLCATVSYKIQEDVLGEGVKDTEVSTFKIRQKAVATLRFDPVGYIYSSNDKFMYKNVDMIDNINEEESQSIEHFALPSPARESLFNIAIHILDKKSLLRSVSSAGIILPIMDDIRQHVDGVPLEANDDTLLIIHWKTLWRLLLRTAPHLGDDRLSEPPMNSSAHEDKIFRSTINLIRCCRPFFDQELNIKENIISDKSSEEIWALFHDDLFKLIQMHVSSHPS